MAEGKYKFDPQSSTDNMGSYFIGLDKRWKLDELGDFSKNYEQSYYAVFAIEALREKSILSADAQDRIISQMSQYPWKGGYSTVHFYYGIKRIIGRKRQPEIRQIKYSSPGFIELSVVQEIAVSLGVVVASLCGSIAAINTTYNNIYKGLREREINELSVEQSRLNLAKEQREFLLESIDKMGAHLNLDEQRKIVNASGNELRALKILLSMYRRIRVVSNYQDSQKANLPTTLEKDSVSRKGDSDLFT